MFYYIAFSDRVFSLSPLKGNSSVLFLCSSTALSPFQTCYLYCSVVYAVNEEVGCFCHLVGVIHLRNHSDFRLMWCHMHTAARPSSPAALILTFILKSLNGSWNFWCPSCDWVGLAASFAKECRCCAVVRMKASRIVWEQDAEGADSYVIQSSWVFVVDVPYMKQRACRWTSLSGQEKEAKLISTGSLRLARTEPMENVALFAREGNKPACLISGTCDDIGMSPRCFVFRV